MTELKLATFRINGDRWKAFQDRASAEGSNASAALKSLIDRYLDGSIDIASKGDIPGLERRIEDRLHQFEAELLGKLSG